MLNWHLDRAVSPASLQDLIEMRVPIKPDTAGAAARQATPAQVAALSRNAEAMRLAGDDRAFARAVMGFTAASSPPRGMCFCSRWDR